MPQVYAVELETSNQEFVKGLELIQLPSHPLYRFQVYQPNGRRSRKFQPDYSNMLQRPHAFKAVSVSTARPRYGIKTIFCSPFECHAESSTDSAFANPPYGLVQVAPRGSICEAREYHPYLVIQTRPRKNTPLKSSNHLSHEPHVKSLSIQMPCQDA